MDVDAPRSADESSSQQRAPVYRRAATAPRRARDLVFDRLPPAVRDRLTRGLGNGAPDALLAAPSGLGLFGQRASLAIGIVGVVALLGLGARDLGDLRGRLALQPTSFAALYGALFFAVVAGGGAFARFRSFQRGAPFRAGRYLFSLDLLEVEGGRLRLTSLDTLRGAEAGSRDVSLVFEDGYAVVFPAPENPTAVAAQLNTAIAAARALTFPTDEAKLQRLDPFFEVRATDDWEAASDPRKRSRSWLPWLVAGALATAAPAGYGMLRARNAFSDDLMFDAAKTARADEQRASKLIAYASIGARHLDEVGLLLVEDAAGDATALRRCAEHGGPIGTKADDALFDLAKNDPDELSLYLGRGGLRAEEADEELFAMARRMDTLAAYDLYLEHGKRHAEQVKTQLLPEADFRQAEQSNMVGSLFSFVRRNPGSVHEDEAWKLIHTAYAGALPAFQATEKTPPEGLHFLEALLAALQDRVDPRMVLEIHMDPATSIEEADGVLAAKYGARYLPGAGQFTKSSLSTLSQDIRTAVSGWFGAALPRGVVEIVKPGSDDETRPHLQIDCQPMAYGSSQWRAPNSTSSEPDYVTPLVGFFVQVSGVVPSREGKDTVLTWQARIEDATDGKMQTLDFRGSKRTRNEMLEDAFATFLDSVPGRIVGSFREKL